MSDPVAPDSTASDKPAETDTTRERDRAARAAAERPFERSNAV